MISRYPIYFASKVDEEPLLRLLRERHEEEGIGPFNEPEALSTLQRGIRREQAVIYVIRGRELEGSVGLFFSRPQFSTATVLSDSWLFIRSQYRKSDRAKELVDYAKGASMQLGLPLYMSVNINERTARKEQFMSRQLPKAGSLFVFMPIEETA